MSDGDSEWTLGLDESEEEEGFGNWMLGMDPFSESTSPTARPVKNKMGNRDRGFEAGHKRIWDDYFAENPLYSDDLFKRRFRVSRHLFNRILARCEQLPFFIQRPDAAGKMGASSLQKVVAAFRFLCYGSAYDALDEYCRLSASTVDLAVHYFCQVILDEFKEVYLRSPNVADVTLYATWNASRGFPGMFGSLDCMHWAWKNCPKAWAGQFQGKEKTPTVVLEAVATHDLWIWHAFFGVAGSNNDLNVLDRSPLLSLIVSGK